jgi:hypothetical protein
MDQVVEKATEDAQKEMEKALQAIEDTGNAIEKVTPDTGKTMDGIR